MKNYFKHQFGYINIDDKKLYFTKSGNWTEVNDIGEYHEIGNKGMPVDVYTIGIFSALVFILAFYIFLPSFDLTELALASLLPLGLKAYHLFLVRYSPQNCAVPRERLLGLESKNPFEIVVTFEDQFGLVITQFLLMEKEEFAAFVDRLQHVDFKL